MEQVNYLIIGAGMAGLTLKHFLQDDNTVMVDSQPGRYKIGESIIPEHFHNLEVRRLLPQIKKLPSYTRKMGTIFMTEDEVASFPLPPKLSEMAMHIERAEFEKLMREAWSIPIRKEKVIEIDFEEKIVRTNKQTYKVAKQILDCSGPAMVVASQLDERSEILSVHAVWTYYDVKEVNDDLFFKAARSPGKTYLRFDIPKGRLLPEADEASDWSPSHTTILQRIRDGVWMWQIPLFDCSRLSVGIVSRGDPVSPEAFFDLVERHHAPHYTLSLRKLDNSSPYNSLHRRNHFAQRARVASTLDYILLADAFAFADPIYSVGTGLAVNKAIQVAALLNDGGWTEAKCHAYNEGYEKLLEAAVEAFNFWYSGSLLSDDRIASHVQQLFLRGKIFSKGITKHYAQQVRSAMGAVDSDYEHWPRLEKGKYGL